MTLTTKTIDPGWAKRWFTACRTVALEITGYATAIFLAEMLVKIWGHQ
ncbi:MAG: hypothetical protein ACYDA7_05210 [Acidithiobacillus sp.]